MKRPLITVLGMFLLGELAGQWMEGSIWFSCGAAAAATGIVWRSNRQIATKKTQFSMLLLFLFVLGFAWNYGVRQQENAKGQVFREAAEAGQRIRVEGIVTELKEAGCILSTDAGYLRVMWDAPKKEEEVGEKSGHGVKNRSRMESETAGEEKNAAECETEDRTESETEDRTESGTDIAVGDRISVTGIPEEIPAATNPGSFDSREYYRSEGVTWQLRTDKPILEEAGANLIRTCLGRIRAAGVRHLSEVFPEPEAGVMAAMLLGERAGVDAELKDLYRRSGIAHILAISGMHVSLIGAAVLAILLRLGLSRRMAAVVTIFLLFFYGLLTGFAPATLRAVWMLTAVNLSGVFRRTADLPTSAGLSLFLILILQPYRISSNGMLMSFLSITGVVAGAALYERIFGRNRFMSVPIRLRSGVKRLIGGLLFGLTIQLFLLPVILREYYAVTPYGLLLNLIVIPLLTIAVASGVTALLVSFLPGFLPVAEVLALPGKWILRLYTRLCELTGELPGHEVVTGHISMGEMLLLILLITGLVWLYLRWLSGKKGKAGRRYLLTLAGMAALISLVAAGTLLRNRLQGQIAFMDVGQGDGCLVHTSGGADLIFDFGSSSREELGTRVLIPALRYYGITEIDGVFLSHMDVDHISGVRDLLEQAETYGLRIDTLFFAAGTREDETMKELLSLARDRTEVRFLAQGDTVECGDAEVSVLLPERGTTGEGNEHSMVQLLSLPECRVLFTGDIGEEQEEKLAGLVRGSEADILKVAHHGSRYSSSEAFLREMGGGTAVISCGRKNRYGHPAEETLERLRTAGFTVYRTDLQGAVILDLP